MDIASLVHAVMAAFEDASKLVQRISKDREAKGEPLPDEPTRNLLDSLALGAVIVRGHYDQDVKRFGEQYACGDGQAREQLKDVLINLQMTLIITLRSVMMDEVDLDFNVLQSASDDCRVNAGVSLGQLSQRISSTLQAEAYYPLGAAPHPSSTTPLLPPMSPSLGYSSSRSTHSSAPYRMPPTPDPLSEHLKNMTMSPPVRPKFIERTTSTSSGGSQDHHLQQTYGFPRPNPDYVPAAPPVGGLKPDEVERLSMRRRSSQALAQDDNILLMFPQPDGQPILSATAHGKEPYIGNGVKQAADVSRTSSGHQSQSSRDRFGPDDYQTEGLTRGDVRQSSHSTIYDMYQQPTPERHASTSYSHRAQNSNPSSPEYVRFLQENARPPRPQPRSDSLYQPRNGPSQPHEQPRKPFRTNTGSSTYPAEIWSWQVSPSVPAPIPVKGLTNAYPPPPPIPQGLPPNTPKPNQSNVSKPLFPTNAVLNPAVSRAESVRTVNSSVSTTALSIALGPLNLPSDKDLLGFCKGAFRLQIGLESKAFKVANRPVGYASMIPYWRCEKCSFEGPVHNSAVLTDGKKKANWKPVKLFDPRIRTSESGAIRYKWAFLAKCHVSLKSMVPYDTPLGQSGAFGTFGCVFCAAEGKQRGWFDKMLTSGDSASLAGSAGSVRSAKTANTGVRATGGKAAPTEPNSTPIFGNIGSFLAHIEAVHRSEDGWPNAEMQGRMKLVLGRTAPVEEDGWDINIVPPS